MGSIKVSKCFNSIKGLLLDITGVLYEGGSKHPIEGSVDAIKRLRHMKIPFCFVTNETQETRSALVKKLTNFGFSLSEDEVVAPGIAVIRYLAEKKLKPLLLVHPNLLPEFSDCDQSSPNCVVIGDAAEHFTYDNMNKAFKLLISSEQPVLISLGKGKYYKEVKHGLVLDVGAYATALEYACNIESVVIGKPSHHFYQIALNQLGLDACEVAMVGDDINSDVGGAQNCDMKGFLVRTGKFRPCDENHDTVKPDGIFNNLAGVVDYVASIKN